MGKKIRLGACRDCNGFVLVDIADDSITPILEECRHCGVQIDRSSVVDVPLIGADLDEEADAVVCDNCGERWEDVDLGIVIDELDGCPTCNPAAYGSLSVDS